MDLLKPNHVRIKTLLLLLFGGAETGAGRGRGRTTNLIDKENTMTITCLDLIKTFDTLLHVIFIRKLVKCSLEVTTVIWIDSYLKKKERPFFFLFFKVSLKEPGGQS